MATKQTQKYQKLAREFIQNIPPYPKGKYKDRGIVIPAGGPTYFIGMWVCVSMLRHFGCNLPVEVWYLGRHEMDDRMKQLAAELGDVKCIDAYKVARKVKGHRWSSKPGWELNPFCLLHSRFREVLFLDADNVPIKNPEYLFETKAFKETGAIFWPDYLRLARNRPIWKICEVPYKNESEFESGQIVVDKEKCWRELQLTMHYNMYSGFYYQHVWGDKETYHMAWRRLNTKYTMIPYPIKRLPTNGSGASGSLVMCQHDLTGNIVFQHRNMRKWTLNLASNTRIAGFKYESKCLQFVRQLAKKWDGVVSSVAPSTNEEKKAFDELVRTEIYEYCRVGYDRRHISFKANQRIAKGRAKLEQTWEVEERDGQIILSINGDGKHTMELRRREDGSWVGRWLIHEKMPIRLIPTTKVKGKRTKKVAELLQRRFIYRRIGHDKRVMELHPDGRITEGRGTCEKKWELRMNESIPQLIISGDSGITCVLQEMPDGVWEGKWETREKPKIELIPLPENE